MADIKIITKYWGQIDPNDIESYRKKGGYGVMQQVLRTMQPQEVIQQIKDSGLQGRGGAGFLTGEKWNIAALVSAKQRYIVCNLDESEPGTFKDVALAEQNPHQLIEGMLIAAYAVGAQKGYVYLNGHFHQARHQLHHAILQAQQRQFLGNSVMGFAFDFSVEIFFGAGAYICGEESALINSIEGNRGEPRMRPPYPCNCGLSGCPTVVNNAETLASVPWIMQNGAAAYAAIGMKHSPGTKLFSIDGAVKRPGLYEIPIGISVRSLIHDVAGGMQEGKRFWFAQVGGSSGRLVLSGKLDEIPSFDREAAIPMGSGAVVVVDKQQDIKQLLLGWSHFFQRESCGKCVPCREGTFRLKQMLERLANGNFTANDREDLDKLIWVLDNTTFCPLGKFSVTALKDALQYKLVKELNG